MDLILAAATLLTEEIPQEVVMVAVALLQQIKRLLEAGAWSWLHQLLFQQSACLPSLQQT